MNNNLTKVILFVILNLTISVCAFAEKRVSIYVEGDLSAIQEQIVNGAFVGRVTASKNFAVYERNEKFINSVTREHDYQTSGRSQNHKSEK